MGPLQFLFIRLTTSRRIPTSSLLRSHLHSLHSTAAHILAESRFSTRSPQKYFLYVIFTLTLTLTVAACTWFLAVSLTTTSDVTAMYNCSAFFAYAFSVPLLGERFRWDKACAVGVAIAGVFCMAWGTAEEGSTAAHTRFIGDAVCPRTIAETDPGRLSPWGRSCTGYMRCYIKPVRVQSHLLVPIALSCSPMHVLPESVSAPS
jgi:drug/metabolite transporter (DMT)-like permease